MPCVSLQKKAPKFQEESSDLETQLLELGFFCENSDVADPDALLEPETFTTVTAYDALNRATSIRTPHNASVPASEILPAYNEASLLESVNVKLRGAATATNFVQNIDYDAKGQRERIQYGNGSTTGYTYDEKTFRLKRLLTTRNNGADILQDLNYTYDAAGNVAQIDDDAQQTIFFNGSVVSPSQKFECDALYRLVKATGREHVFVNADSEPEAEGYNSAQISPQDGTAMRNYTREWEYDSVGNILSIIHQANGNAWTRTNTYALNSNRLTSSTVGSASANFSYNAHGSMTSMPHLSAMDWDFAEKLSHVTRGTTEAYYNYDGSGIRTRKVVEKNGVVETRLYLGGFEIWRKTVNGTLETERETLHVMDNKKRIALVETLTVENGNRIAGSAPVQRYQFDNHLGSASLELDESASIISYEEYYPYGDTSYRAGRSASEVSRKRHRYIGKEKDEESGLYYHGARYYACWLGRWTAADPIGIGDGLNVYMYVHGNPVGMLDKDGKRSGPSPDHDVIGQLLGGPLDPRCTFNCGRSTYGESFVDEFDSPKQKGQKKAQPENLKNQETPEAKSISEIEKEISSLYSVDMLPTPSTDKPSATDNVGNADENTSESGLDVAAIGRSSVYEVAGKSVSITKKSVKNALANAEKMDLDNIDLNKKKIKEANRTASTVENSAKNGFKSAEEKVSTIKQARLDQSISTKNYNMEIKKAEESLARNASIMKRFTKIARIASGAVPVASAVIDLTVNRVTQNNPWGRDLLTVGAGTVAALVASNVVSGLLLSFILAVVVGYKVSDFVGNKYDEYFR